MEPPGDILLLGPPEAPAPGLQVMQIDLTDDVLHELIRSTEGGQQPQILFGRAPQLRYDDKTQLLETATEKLRNELYLSDNNENLTFAGLISHSLAVQEAQENTARVDTALEALKSSLANIQEEKEARKTVIDSTPINLHRRNLSKRDNLLKPSHLNTPGRSAPSSPGLGSASSPRVGPTSAPAQEDFAKLKAIRFPTLHLLASKPRSAPQLARLLRCKPEEAKLVLAKVAKIDSHKNFSLTDRAYKELDVFEFPYQTDDERKSAIENAIRAYDRQRLPADDKIWQRLLPKEERGKGTTLSKLHIRPPTQAAAAGTKLPKKSEKKEPTKKPDSEKKESKEGIMPTAKKATKKQAVEDGPKLPTKTVAKEPAKVVKRNKPEPQEQPVRKKKVPKSAAVVSKEDRESDVPSNQTQRPSKPAKKAVAPASKPLSSKPKNPSPLSASPPVNASDFEDNHPVHKALSASASPAKTSSLSSMSASNSDRSLKRKANDLDNNIHSHSTARPKQRRVESDAHSQSRTPVNGFKPGSHTATPSTGLSSNSAKRKVATTESDSPASASTRTPTKRPRLSTNTQSTATQPSTSSDSLSDSSPASPLALSYRQTIELSQRFSTYYEKYHKLHTQLSTSPEPPSSAQRAELLRMHNALSHMKEEIRVGAAKPRVAT